MSVGKQLKEARLAKRLSLTDVTTATKIQPWVLEALEADKLHDQMSPIYARGFLGSYARFLKIPPQPLLDQIQWPGEQMASQSPAQIQVQSELQKQVAARATVLEVPVAPAPAPMKPAQQAEALPKTVKIEMPKIVMPKVQIPWARIGAALRAQARPAAIGAAIVGVLVINPLRWMPKIEMPKMAAKPAASASAPKQASKKTVVAKAASQSQKQLLKTASVAPIPVVKEPQAPPAPAVAAAPKIEPLQLSISATKATWIRVRADGQLVSQQRLERGAKETWVAKKSLDIIVAKPSQVELSLNGQSINAIAIQNEGRLAISHKGIAKLADDAT